MVLCEVYKSLYCIQQNIQGGNLSRLEWKMVIRWKTLAVACLLTYITNRLSHNSWENFTIE